MRFPIRLRIPTVVFTIFCAVAVAGLLAASPEALAGSRSAQVEAEVPVPWKAVAASGLVEARLVPPGEDWQLVRRGDRFQPKTELRTGRRGRTTLIQNANVLIVDPSSHVKLPDDLSDSTVLQDSGSVIYEVEERGEPNFRVFTPYLVAGVKGTVFMVTVTDTYAAVTVDEGIVEVTSRTTGETLDVEAGESIRLDAGESAEMERVSFQARSDRETRGIRKETRRLARVEHRRLEKVRAEWNARLAEGDPLVGRNPNPHGQMDVKGAGFVDGNDAGTLLDSTDIENEINGGGNDLGTREDELSQDLAHDEARKQAKTANGGC